MRPTGPASAQIVCSGCRSVLVYPAGAQNVRCARCSTITSVAPPPPAADMAQLCCSNAQCRVVLLYPRGAAQVQCSVCGNLNDATQANQLGHVVCGGCATTLAYAFGAQSVKCSVCGFVTPAQAEASGSNALAAQPHTRPASQQAQPPAEQQQQQQQQPQPVQLLGQQAPNASSKQTAVLVVNPDDKGKEALAIGVTGTDAK